METDLLIQRLSEGVSPVRPAALPIRMLAGLGAGVALSAIVLVTVIGVRADLGEAVRSGFFWTKAAYATALAAVAIAAAVHLGRPEARGIGQLQPMAFAVLVLGVVAVAQLGRAPAAMWPAMWLGTSWAVCPVRILALSAPVFVALVWCLRRLAPTDLRSAGLAAGLAAGAVGAILYCLRCPESSAPFVVTWYSLGILIAGSIGAVLGPRLLRW